MRNIISIFTIILTITFSLYSCADNEPYFGGYSAIDSTAIPTFSSVEDVLGDLAADAGLDSAQTANFTDDTGIEFTGSGGVTINIQPGACSGSGLPSTTALVLHLKEFLTIDKMFYGNVQTESNGDILVTGGNFWWNVTTEDGTNVTVDPNMVTSNFTIQTDITGYESGMTYFVGNETTAGGQQIINWNLGQGENTVDGGEFFIFQTDLGWANCDVLLDYSTGEYTQFKVGHNPTPAGELIDKAVYMFINDFPSIINIYTVDGDFLKTYDGSIPVGLNATLLAVAVDQDGYLMFGSQDIAVTGDDTFTVDVGHGTTEGLQLLVNQITQ